MLEIDWIEFFKKALFRGEFMIETIEESQFNSSTILLHREYLQHCGDVNLESGNIRYSGNVQIDGSIQPSMFVGATGQIKVNGNVSKATLHATQSIKIEDNVFSSTIVVGEKNRCTEELIGIVQAIIKELRKIQTATMNCNSFLPYKVVLIDFYPSCLQLIKEFIQKVKNKSGILSQEWSSLAEKLYNALINPVTKHQISLHDFESLLLEGRRLVNTHNIRDTLKSQLTIPYAVNSALYSNGDIHITTKGAFHCIVCAQQNVTLSGVCRGGEVSAMDKISLQEVGCQNGVKTVVRTSNKGSITLGLVHSGTEIQIGNKKHTFLKKQLGVHARLDEHGELVI